MQIKAQEALRVFFCDKHLYPDWTTVATLRSTVNLWGAFIAAKMVREDTEPRRMTTIVGDVTGSMYKYTAQLLLWVKTNPIGSLSKNFVFFNDGDNMPDKDKKLGKTGGIYFKSCTSYAEVESLMKTTMLKGGGGDYPENNIEALLKAEKVFPATEFQVMIADNWAAIKDKVLWQYLTKPVRIVVCGATGFNVNIDYLNLARKTNGSVHLMESDLYNLAGLKEGEILKVGKNSFVVKNGMFVETGDAYNK